MTRHKKDEETEKSDSNAQTRVYTITRRHMFKEPLTIYVGLHLHLHLQYHFRTSTVCWPHKSWHYNYLELRNKVTSLRAFLLCEDIRRFDDWEPSASRSTLSATQRFPGKYWTGLHLGGGQPVEEHGRWSHHLRRWHRRRRRRGDHEWGCQRSGDNVFRSDRDTRRRRRTGKRNIEYDLSIVTVCRRAFRIVHNHCVIRDNASAIHWLDECTTIVDSESAIPASVTMRSSGSCLPTYQSWLSHLTLV